MGNFDKIPGFVRKVESIEDLREANLVRHPLVGTRIDVSNSSDGAISPFVLDYVSYKEHPSYVNENTTPKEFFDNNETVIIDNKGRYWSSRKLNISLDASYSYDYRAAEGQTEFNVEHTPNTRMNVFHNGILLAHGDDYITNNGVSIILTTPARLGDIIQIRGAEGGIVPVAVLGAQNIRNVARFTNATGMWVNSPNEPVTTPIQFDTTNALNGGVACVYYKANEFEIEDPYNKLSIISKQSFVPNELILVWMVYDQGADCVHVNLQTYNADNIIIPVPTNDSLPYDLPFDL